MNDEQIEDFHTWLEVQPGFVNYERCRSFISDMIDGSKADAEIEMANLVKSDEIKFVKTSKTQSQKIRIFTLPLDPLTESNVREVWDGSPVMSMEVEDIAKSIRDRTGHDLEDIVSFMKSIDNAEIKGDMFKWQN